MIDSLSERYLNTVNLLKELDLWDLEIGMDFLPIVQYCMPPPSTDKITLLLEDLVECEVNTNWAPLTKTKKLLKKIQGKPSITKGTSNRYGSLYPIQNGIHRIANQDTWLPKDKAFLINRFVTIVFKTTAESHLLHLGKYYDDVYKLRDALIVDYAKKNKLIYVMVHDNNIKKKFNEVRSIYNFECLLGIKGDEIRPSQNNIFWANPPEVKFTLPGTFFSSDEEKSNIIDTRHPDKINVEKQPFPEEQLLNNTQQDDASYLFQPRWARNNVRSLADMNQLSWSSIFSYWEYTLKSKKPELFTLSILALLTGIRKSRLLKAIYNPTEELTFENLYISDKNTISFKVNNAATRFNDDNSNAHDYVTLQLPTGLEINKATIQKGLKEEGTVRGFSKNNSGPIPFLNNVSRAGHTLFRKNIAGELLSFILSGNIPIEFKARSAYHQTGNSEVNELFISGLNELKKAFSKHGLRYRLVRQELEKITPIKTPLLANHDIGSQLAIINWDFSSFNIAPYKQKSLPERVLILNQLELYYFWMLEYAYATRPFGASTEHLSDSRFVLHRDKDSNEYMEAKLLIESKLVKEQKEQLDKCRQSVMQNCSNAVFSNKDLNNPTPLFHTLVKTFKEIESKTLLSDAAVKLTERYWGITPALNRNNAHRHQCATYIHSELGEVYADTWLGHHIDGWYFSSPQSTSTVGVLNKVAASQEQWLEKLGFHLLKNPLR